MAVQQKEILNAGKKQCIISLFSLHCSLHQTTAKIQFPFFVSISNNNNKIQHSSKNWQQAFLSLFVLILFQCSLSIQVRLCIVAHCKQISFRPSLVILWPITEPGLTPFYKHPQRLELFFLLFLTQMPSLCFVVIFFAVEANGVS